MIESKFNKYKYFLIIFSASLLFFHHLGEPGFFMDGLIYAALGKNAVLYNTWLNPFLSKTFFASFHDHIPFMIILEGVFFKLFGATFLTARLFVNLFTLGTFLSLIYFAKKNINSFQVILASVLFLLSLPLLKHSRHPNFDMPLMMMCFLAINFYIEAIDTNFKSKWYLTGICFGFAMLFKGPMAIFIPMTLILHLLITKKMKTLLTITPWLALATGFVVFSMWPLALFLTGKMQLFNDWFKFTILDTIFGSRGVVENDYLLYVRHLFTFTPINMIFAIVTFYKLRKYKLSTYYQVHLIFFLSALALTSAMKFKYSHYIMPLYPALAVIAASGVEDIKIKNFHLQKALVGLIVIASLVVFFLPQNPTKVRDYEIFEIVKNLESKNLKPDRFILEKGAYPFWSLSALMSFLNGTTVYERANVHPNLEEVNSLYIVHMKSTLKFTSACTEIYQLPKYTAQAFYCP